MTIFRTSKEWEVTGTARERWFWTVRLSDFGVWRCSCPRWKFQQKRCRHIRYAQRHPEEGDKQ